VFENTTASARPHSHMSSTGIYFDVHPGHGRSFVLDYRLSSAAEVALEVHTLQGKRLHTLVNGRTMAGDHRFVWSPENLSAGTYSLALSLGALRVARKAIIP